MTHEPSADAILDTDPLIPRRKSGPVRGVGLALAIALVAGLTIVAWNRFGTDPTTVRSPLIGNPSPAFALPGLDGGTVSSADLDGQMYIVNFWASWCVPCRKEAPYLEAFYQRRSPEGVGMVGIVYNDRRSDARQFREEFGLTFPQAMDPDGVAAIDFGVFGIPETFIVNADGIVMAKLVGAVGPTTLDEVLADVLGGETVTEQNDDYRTGPDDSSQPASTEE